MRIIAGRFKGRRLQSPRGGAVRPTSDGLRETLFNVLGDRVAGASVLDGFAGTGAIGLEALSRGATRATFVEQDRHAIAVLTANVAACGAEDACVIIRHSFVGISARDRRFDPFHVIILDPPYDWRDLDALVAEAAAMLHPDGVLVLEHSRRRAAPEGAERLIRRRVLTAGDSALAFYNVT